MPSFYSRVRDTTTTTGTGTITITGTPPAGFRAFATPIPIGGQFHYCIEAVDGSGNPTGDWEEGIGTLVTSTTISRNKLLSSSTGAFVSFAAGTKNVFVTVSGDYLNKNITGAQSSAALPLA